MWEQIGLICGFLSLLGLVVLLSSKSGSKAAQLEVLKQELKRQAKEQAHAQKLLNHVAHMPSDDVRKRLQDMGSK